MGPIFRGFLLLLHIVLVGVGIYYLGPIMSSKVDILVVLGCYAGYILGLVTILFHIKYFYNYLKSSKKIES